MILGRILNSDAVLNSYETIGSLELIPGSGATLVFQLYQSQSPTALRYIPISGATLTAHFPQSGGLDPIDKVCTALVDDRSIWSVTLAPADTVNFLGGNLTFDLVEGLVTSKGYIRAGISIIITGEC